MKRALRPSAFGAVVLLAACSLPWVGLVSGRITGDIGTFGLYAQRMVAGLVPYRDFFFDWAPGSVWPVYAPALLPGASYNTWFHVLAYVYGACAIGAGAATLTLLGVARGRLYASVAAMAALPAALGVISLNSLDFWPAIFAAAGIAALVAGLDVLGLGLLGAGIAAKVYPVVVVPLALVWVWRRHGRAAALRAFGVCAAVVAAVAAPFAVVGHGGLGYSTYQQFKRGLQMESLGASLLMALDHLGLYHARVVVGTPYSLDVAGETATAVAAVVTLVLAAALLGVYLAYASGRDEPQRFVTAAAAAVTAYVTFGRVLSPQYLLWLVPLVPLVAGMQGVMATGLLFTACALTMTWFPGRFSHLIDVSPVSWFVLARNIVLVLVFVCVLQPVLRSSERPLRQMLRELRLPSTS